MMAALFFPLPYQVKADCGIRLALTCSGSDGTDFLQGGAAWVARRAHNAEVMGSNPIPASNCPLVTGKAKGDRSEKGNPGGSVAARVFFA